MDTKSLAKKILPPILTLVFGALLFLCVIGCELSLHFNIYKLETLRTNDIMCMLSDAFFIPSVFLLGTALIGFFKYVSLVSVFYSVFMAFRQLFTNRFIPKSCRRAYREYRNAAKEGGGTGIAILFAAGFVFLSLAVIFMCVNKYI